jgi:hypothetical protein
MEHPAQRHSMHDAAVDAKTNDATRKLVPSRRESNVFVTLSIRTETNHNSTNYPSCGQET